MNQLVKVKVLSLLIVAFFASTVTKAQTSVAANLPDIPSVMDQKFLGLETKWMTAWKDKDEKTVRQILSDDFTLTSSLSTGDLVNKETWIAKALHGFDCKSFKFDKIKVRIYGNTAIVNSLYEQEATANDKDWSGKFLITDVWVNQNGAWQVVTRHATWLH